MRSDRAQRVLRRDDEHEPIGAKRQGLQPGYLHCSGDNADIRRAVGDGGDDLVTEPFLQVDVHLRMGGEEIAERLREKFGQRVGVGQQPDLPFDPSANCARSPCMRSACCNSMRAW